jgi:hypothetical protein
MLLNTPSSNLIVRQNSIYHKAFYPLIYLKHLYSAEEINHRSHHINFQQL